jgi:biopolymer transport protein TolR
MAMNVGGAGGKYSADINMTPMIDVLLVLLVIFMMQVSLQRKAMDVQLPPVQRVTQEEASGSSNQIVLEIAEDGGMSINSEPVTKAGLDAKIHEIYDNRPNKLMFVKTARNRKFGDVVSAMDIARGAGVQVVGFTPPESK